MVESSKRRSIFISLIFILKCFTKPFIITNGLAYFLTHDAPRAFLRRSMDDEDDDDDDDDKSVATALLNRLNECIWCDNTEI